MKNCITCGEQKPLSEFQKRKDVKCGYRNQCNTCRSKYNSTRHRKIKYSITQNGFDSILKIQNNCCDICKNILVKGQGTHIDHDHTTGKIRGILCNPCNRALGYFKDSTEILKSAILYLGKHDKKVLK